MGVCWWAVLIDRGYAWAIAMAMGDTPMPLHSPPQRHSGGGLNAAARHILLALYLHHRDLLLSDPHLPAPCIAAPATETLAETAPEEVADYFRPTCAVEGAVGCCWALRAGLGVVGVHAWPPVGLRGRMVARMLWACAVGAELGAGLCGGGGEAVLPTYGTMALVGTVARAGGRGRWGVVHVMG